MAAARQEVLSLYRRVLRVARSWQALSGLPKDTETERLYIAQEARTLFRQNKTVTEPQLIKTHMEECKARIEIGLHYRNPYPRPFLARRDKCPRRAIAIPSALVLASVDSKTHLPPMGLATQKGRKLRAQTKLRKQARPIYLESHDETS